MMSCLHIFDWDFNDHSLDWEPEDPFDFEFWITVNMGDGEAGNYYQIHVCAPKAIGGISDKKWLFVLPEWHGFESLIELLNDFLDERIEENRGCDPFQVLSKYWLWEYERHNMPL